MNHAKLCADKHAIRNESIDERIYSAFMEHLGNVIYHGIYAPEHPTANADGFREDVIELVKALRLPLIRYPGGNFVCSYRWEDTVGPVALRPARADLAWRQLEPNTVGLAEFYRWVKAIGSELGMAVNLSTRGAVDAANLVEYCNLPSGTYWSDLRRSHGNEEPFDIRVWFVGNEVDGPWNIGMKRAEDYAWDAAEAAKAMRRIDPGIELVAVGSSGTQLPTYLEWDRKVLEQVYDCCDYISLHRYMAMPAIDSLSSYDRRDAGDYLELASRLDRNIQDVIAACDYVRGLKRSDKNMFISMDEYNAIDIGPEDDAPAEERQPWQIGPNPHARGISMRTTLLFGLSMITLMHRSDRIRIACQSILINGDGLVICEEGEDAWVNGSYYVFLHCSRYGRGKVLEGIWECDRSDTTTFRNTEAAQGVCVYHEESGELDIFVVNKRAEKLDFRLEPSCFAPLEPLEHLEMTAALSARNSAQNPDAIRPVSKMDVNVMGREIRCELAGYSWNVIRLKEER